MKSYADPFPHRIRIYWLLSFIRPSRRAFAGGLAHACVSPS